MQDYRTEFYERYRTATSAPLSSSRHVSQIQIRQFMSRWGNWLPAEKESAILDVACGAGEFLSFLKQRGYTSISGVDLSSEQVDAAMASGLDDITCENALEYLSGKHDRYDLISAFNLFEHLYKHELMQILAAIHSALKPGGKLIAITPNGISPFSGSTRYWDFSHELSFTPASWRQLARITGFSAVSFEEFGPVPHSAAGTVRSILWSALRLGLDFVSYVEVARPRDISRVYTADMKIILFK